VIGGLLREATTTGRPVRVYGEMVALLWEAGDVLAALELESLWNDLGESLRFSLFCSYAASSVSGPQNATARQHLCHLHSRVIKPSTDGGVTVPTLAGNEVMAQFAAEISAPRAVRLFVIDSLRQWCFPDDLIDDAALVSSELAANAVLHATSAFSVALRVDGPLLRLEVRDCRVQESTLTARRERGLGVVSSLALRWGVDDAPGGKIVWAEFGPPAS
jgi:anti-sigma regulatory factor (Ser/Thr protein kinase)